MESSAPLPVQAGYDRWAAIYETDGNPLIALEERHFDRLLGPVAGRAGLDLGCGTGRHAVRLARAGARMTAVDFSTGMLARARAAAGDLPIAFSAHDLHAPLPFADGAFAFVCAGLVLEHLVDLPAFYRELRRVLAPGGVAVVSTLHPAMQLRDVQARFTDPATGEVVRVAGRPQPFAELVLAPLQAGLQVAAIEEHAPDAAFAAAWPRASRYVGWPMLALFRFLR